MKDLPLVQVGSHDSKSKIEAEKPVTVPMGVPQFLLILHCFQCVRIGPLIGRVPR